MTHRHVVPRDGGSLAGSEARPRGGVLQSCRVYRHGCLINNIKDGGTYYVSDAACAV
jgi:hypothetical protein